MKYLNEILKKLPRGTAAPPDHPHPFAKSWLFHLLLMVYTEFQCS